MVGVLTGVVAAGVGGGIGGGALGGPGGAARAGASVTLFLDAIAPPSWSPRRSAGWATYFNQSRSGKPPA